MIARLASGARVEVGVGVGVRVGKRVRVGVGVGVTVGDAVGVDVGSNVGEAATVFVAGGEAVTDTIGVVGAGSAQERHPRMMPRSKLPKMIRRFAFSLIRFLTFSRPSKYHLSRR